MEFLDKTKWQSILGKAVRDAYSDIFVMKRDPGAADVQLIAGKYKSTYNLSQTAAERSARTFLALLDMCDKEAISGEGDDSGLKAKPPSATPKPTPKTKVLTKPSSIGLHYNIQIHLPATKDVEVYNAIFKSLREHIIE